MIRRRQTTVPDNRHRPAGIHRNTRPLFVVLLLPMAAGLAVAALMASGVYRSNLAGLGSKRLETVNWQQADAAMKQAQPGYVRKFAYYKLREGQTLAGVAAFFGIDERKLARMNPGIIAAGATIKLPPIEKPFQPVTGPNGRLRTAVVKQDRTMLRVSQQYRLRQPVVTTVPELMEFLAPYDAIERAGPGVYRLKRAVSLDGDIRLDVTPATVNRLELASTKGQTICLCFDQSAVLFKDVAITTYDPATGQPDKQYFDGRSFVRMKNGRMDIIGSRFTYLGNALGGADDSISADDAGEAALRTKAHEKPKADPNDPIQSEGGVYGISWRISKGTYGANVTTGWVENSRFDYNHFGAFTFGASGMAWVGNHFARNDVYGLDPHDDSNNALVIGNVFEHNGKHGFIVSKRCNYNIIRGNVSTGNKLHGFMLHQDSAYNLIDNNIAHGNYDNFVIYQSNYNTISNNRSYEPMAAHVRINSRAANNYVTGNHLVGGSRGVYLYDTVRNTYISGNVFSGARRNLKTMNAVNTLLANNTVDGLTYDLAPDDGERMIYGPNRIDTAKRPVPDMASHQPLKQ